MKYNDLELKRHEPGRRSGRGIGAGRGKTAGRGTKGQGARAGAKTRPGFEGGQMPLYMRIPKLRGFKSHRHPPAIVFTGQLSLVKKSLISNQELFEAGLISDPHIPVKLLAKGDVPSKKDVSLQAASAKAVEAVQTSGGSFKKIPRLPRKSKKKDTGKDSE